MHYLYALKIHKKILGIGGSTRQTSQKVWIARAFLRALTFELINYLTDSLFHSNSVLYF